MPNVELASAYVSLIPEARGIGADIAKELNSAGLDKVGAKVGDDTAKAFSGSFGKAAFVAAGAAAGTALVAGAVEAIQREAAGDKLAASLNLDPAQSAAAGKIAGDLYAGAYGDSLEQVNEAVAGVVSSLNTDLGDAESVERLSAKALDAASAFGLDLNDAIGQAGTLLRTGLATDADQAFDIMTAGLQAVAPELRGELGEATKEYSKFFADLGISGTEALGLLASADDQFSLDKTGDAIKELTIRSTDMSALSVGAYEKMGLSAQDMSNRILAGGDTARGAFGEIVDGLLGIKDPTEQANTAIALFGTPLEDLGTAAIPEFLAGLDSMGTNLGNVEGRAAAMGDTLNDNAATKIEGAKRTFEGWLAGLVEAPGPIGDTATAIAGIGSAVTPIAPALTGVGLIFKDQFSSMASTALDTGKKVVSSIGSTTAATVKSTAATAANTAATAASKAGALAVAAAQKLWAGAQWALNAAMNANPIMLVVVAIAALVAAAVWAYQNVDWFRNIVDTAFQAIASVATWLWETILRPIFDHWQIAISILMGPIGLLAALVISNWDLISGAISWAWNSVIKPIWDAIYGFVVNQLIPSFLSIADTARSVWDGIVAVISWAWNSVIKPVWDAIYGFIVDILIPYYQQLWAIAQEVWNGIVGVISWAWNSVIKPIWDAIYGFIVNQLIPYYQQLWTVAQTVWNGIVSAVQGAWNSISGIFETIKGGVQGLIDAFWRVKDGVFSALGGVADTIKAPFVAAFDAIKSLWNSTVGGFNFSVPDWIPFVGGKSFTIPKMHTGGWVPGAPGSEMLAVLQAGEYVVPANVASEFRGGGGGGTGPEVLVQVTNPAADAYEIGSEVLYAYRTARR